MCTSIDSKLINLTFYRLPFIYFLVVATYGHRTREKETAHIQLLTHRLYIQSHHHSRLQLAFSRALPDRSHSNYKSPHFLFASQSSTRYKFNQRTIFTSASISPCVTQILIKRYVCIESLVSLVSQVVLECSF